MMTVAILLIVVAALLGAPLFLVLAAVALAGFLSLGGDSAAFASLIEPMRGVASQDIFLAIPLFTFAGFVMAAAGTPRRLVDLSRAFVGVIPGGIAIVALAACAFFTAFTGASGVTIIAMGGLLFPILLAERYPEKFALGLMTTGGSRGLIFPPSLPLILYATIAAMTFSPIVEEQRAAGPPASWLAPAAPTAGVPTAGLEDAPAGASADDELDALLGDDDGAAPAEPAGAAAEADAELDALLGDEEEAAPPAPAAPAGAAAEADAELDALLGDDAGDPAAERTVAAAPVVVLGPIARAADAVPQIVILAGRAVGGDSDARDELWRTKIELLRGQKPTSEKLFIAGAVPGALLVLAIALYSMFIAWRRKVAAEPVVGRDIWYAVRSAVWEIPIPFIIVVGIFGGFFTAQEAAGVTAAYVVVIEVLVYRDLTWRRLAKVMRDSMVLVGAVMLILLTALALKDYLVLADIPATLRDLMTAHVSDPLTFLLLLNVFLLVVGCLMDIFSAIMVVVPLIVPLAVAYGIDPIHLGVIFLINLEIGYSTPPVGINLFIASLRFDRPMLKLYAACLPFLAIMLVGLAVITYWPDLSLWLVRFTGVE